MEKEGTVNYSLEGMCPLNHVEGMEEYRDYYVDILGNVWSTKNKRLKKLRPASNRKNGYPFVILSIGNGKKRRWFVHQLVALAFIGKPEVGQEVNHKNRNSFDNRLVNLEWCTREQNIDHLNSTKGATIDEVVKEKAKVLHAHLLESGEKLPDLHSFINALLEGEIDRLSQFLGKN